RYGMPGRSAPRVRIASSRSSHVSSAEHEPPGGLATRPAALSLARVEEPAEHALHADSEILDGVCILGADGLDGSGEIHRTDDLVDGVVGADEVAAAHRGAVVRQPFADVRASSRAAW